jgi:HlyD family secretion protein
MEIDLREREAHSRGSAGSRRSRRAAERPGALLGAAIGLALAAGCGDRVEVARVAAAQAAVNRESLVALARLEPKSQVVRVGTSISDVVAEILVEEGDLVEREQILVRLESYTLRQAEVEAAMLARERATLRRLELEAQRARIRSIEAELEYARQEVTSQKGLSEKGFSAGHEFRDAQLRVKRSEEGLNEARAELKRMKTSGDLALREAENKIKQAEVRLESTLIRAPLTGKVLRISVKEGERISTRVLSIGATDEMYAVGEIHANEIRLVAPGQKARFTSPALPMPIDGVVDDVGEMIFSNHITGEDPTAPKGLRVVPVRVRLEKNELAQRMTYLEGQLRIFLDENAAR